MTGDRHCGIYLRISLDVTGDEQAVTRQREDCQKIAQARGWVIVGEYVDNDTSASGKVPRPSFDRLLDDIGGGRVDTVISWSMDRLTRNRRDRLRILELGESLGLLLAFARGSDLDLATPSGRLTADILASVARHEIEQMSDRRKRANEQRAALGIPPGGRRPFGYTADARTLVEDEAGVVRWCAEQVLAGRGLWWLVAQLEERGVRTTPGGPWRHGELRRMLANPRYAGRRMHRGVDVGPGQWPAILDEDTFAAVRAVILDPARARPGAPARHLLGGVARCGPCGGVVYGTRLVGKGYAAYLCESRRHVSVKSGPVDAWVVDVLAERMGRPDAAGVFARPGGGPDMAGLRRQDRGLRARLDALAEAFAADEIDRGQLAAASARIRGELAVVAGSMAAVAGGSVAARVAASQDPGGEVRGMAAEDRPAFRGLLAEVAVVRLWPAGRGARVFREESVTFDWVSG